MILKPADDKSKRLALLEELQRSTQLDPDQKNWLRDEIDRTKSGIAGECEAAFFLDSFYRDRATIVMHDLRFVVDGEVAQIDHLVLDRLGEFLLIETKNYSGNLRITSAGEFSVMYGTREFGVPSPIEQSRRHERVLRRVLDNLEITGRLGSSPVFSHLVMIHPQGRITRPPQNEFDTSSVIKADQYPTWLDKQVERESSGVGGALRAFRGLANIRSSDTILEWAEKIKRQHRPTSMLDLPDFMKPRRPPPAAGLAPSPHSPQPSSPATVPASNSAASGEGESRKRLICMTCNAKISYPEGKFCWNNPRRFGGLQYCREHQAAFPA